MPRILPKTRKRRLLLAIASCGLVAYLVSVWSVSSISLLPPKITPRSLDIAGAGAQVVVDNPRPLRSDSLATDGDYQTLQKRSVLMGSLIASAPVRADIARRIGIRPGQLVGRSRVTANVEAVLTEPDSERRAVTIGEASVPYQIEVHPHPVLPALSIYTQAPTVRQAERLADAAVPALRHYLRALAAREGADPDNQVVLEQSGRARGAIINGGAKVEIFGLTFLLVFLLAAFVLLLLAKLRREWAASDPARLQPARSPGSGPRLPAHDVAVAGRPGHARAASLLQRFDVVRRVGVGMTPLVAGGSRGASITTPGALVGPPDRSLSAMTRSAALKAGDWPRTTRVLPWMIAAMLAVIWLVPFNVIQLSYSLPIDLKFDRLVLPFIIATWVLAIAAGGRGAPKVRITWIHIAIGGVAFAAILSLVVEARDLNHTLELDTSVKKLTLLASYISLFVVIASSIRRREVPAFLKYVLILTVICALGTIWEYRFSYNIFYSFSDKLLPGIFTVGVAESGAIDEIGRRLVRGPGEVPLEAVAMLAMGLPIAVSGLITSKAARTRILYGLATAIILAAAASTERKSALLAPASVFATFAYFRRRELIRLTPLGVVIGVLMLALTPGAAQSVVAQLSGKKLNSVTTVSDRSSDYDAVRPDVFTHLAFGRGYGSYEHTSYRILDMELLRQLIEVGVFGVLAFILMIGTIVGVARRPIRERRPDDAAVALSAACAAVALLVVSTLFDAMAFPHCPYIALSMAGLLAVVVSQPREHDAQEAAWSS
jgi:hypothetical protein